MRVTKLLTMLLLFCAQASAQNLAQDSVWIPACPNDTTKFLRGDGTWQVPPSGGGSPAGSGAEVQFRDGGVFGADSVFTYDKANDALGVGAAGSASNIGQFTKSQDAATSVQVSNTNAVGTTANASFQTVADTAQILMRAHGSGRVATQCGNTLGNTSDITAAAGSAMTLCALGASQPMHFATNSIRRASITADGVFVLVDSGSKPACGAGYAGGIWFDAGTPDTLEACTKDGGSSYAWRDMIATGGGGGGLSYAQVAAAVLGGM